MHRAYSLLEIKSADEEARIIRGIATTPTPDHVGDVVEPLGVEFENPLRLLHHHDSRSPIGEVWLEKPSKDGIAFEARLPKISEPPALKQRVDVAWGEIKHGLVRGISIGFKAIEHAGIKGGGIRYLKSRVLELSLVTIPANAEATIISIKSFDTQRRAALGREPIRVDPNPAGAAASRQPVVRPEGDMQRTLAEQITAFEQKRVTLAARMEDIQNKAVEESRSKNEAEREEFDTLSRDIESVDEELKDLRRMEAVKAAGAVAVKGATSAAEGAAQRASTSSIVVKAPPKLEPGVPMTRIIKVAIMANKTRHPQQNVAEWMYGSDSEVAAFYKAAVPAGTTIPPNWASGLISAEGGTVADYVEFLRPATILGKFGTDGRPALREVSFRAPLITATEGGTAYWVGEGKPKPLTQFGWSRETLEPTKVANICVLTMENVRDSSPKSDMLVRDMLRDAVAAQQDIAFIAPANAGTTNIKPASITNGAAAIASSGDDAAAIRLDARSLIAKFTAADNPPSSGVWIMSSTSSSALGMMMNPLGQPEFPGVSMTGGTFFGMPMIVSDYIGRDTVPEIVVLANARDIWFAQHDGIQIDASDQVSLEMSNTPAQDGTVGTGASMVSMWQSNLVAFRAEHSLNWRRRRPSAVAYLTGVSWGGEVNTA